MSECSVCLEPADSFYQLNNCKCQFCRKCVFEYLRVRVVSGEVLDIPCLSSTCKGSTFSHEEILCLLEEGAPDLLERYHRYKGNRDVERDPNRTFCPNPLCSFVCDIPVTANGVIQQIATQISDQNDTLPSSQPQESPQPQQMATARSVLCPQCGFLFCSLCHAPWIADSQTLLNSGVAPAGTNLDSPQAHHPFRAVTAAASSIPSQAIPVGNLLLGAAGMGPQSNEQNQQNPTHQCEVTYLVNRQRWNLLSRIGLEVNADDVMIKRCPCCGIPVERGPGCAQMLCLNCHHTFCWYCLTVLDGDVFLRHYESGTCRARLGHTPGDLRRHRARVAMALTCCGVVAVLLLPVIIVCSPCILTCVCCVRSLINNSARNNNQQNAGQGNQTAARGVRNSATLNFTNLESIPAETSRPRTLSSLQARFQLAEPARPSANANNSPV